MTDSIDEKNSQWDRLHWSGFLLLLFLTFLAYSPALNGDFLWDDDLHVTKKQAVIGDDSFMRIWTSGDAVYYPLVLTTFWVEWRLWGGEALGFHIVNVALHALNAILLCLLLQRLGVRWAWLAGAIFALHPVHVESVAWITELKNVQSGLFYLLTLLFYLSFLKKREMRWYAATLIMFLAAILSKPSTVMLPVVLLIVHLWLDRPFERKDIYSIVPFFAVSAAASLWTIWEQQYHSGAIGSEWSAGLPERTAVAGHILWFYFLKLSFPYNLSFFYPRWTIDPQSITSYLPLAFLLILCSVLFLKYKTWGKPLLLGTAYFIITLFPVLGFFNIYFMKYSFVADHFQYLASMSLIALFVGGFAWFLEKWDLQRTAKSFGWRQLGKGVGLLLLLIFGLLTWKQSHIYKDMEALMRDSIKKNPKAWMAHSNLGMLYVERGLPDKAIMEYKETLRIFPEHAGAHNSLGNVYLLQGKYNLATKKFTEALKLQPGDKGFLFNLAQSYEVNGNPGLAIKYYKEILENSSTNENPELINAVKNRFLNIAKRTSAGK